MINKVAYIGWEGIHGCEVLNLDENLTALIGATGAGKSTLVMCLDYAILPDRTALDIRPLTDFQDSSTKGQDTLESRISPEYGYAYVVLGITSRDGSQLIAGIYVEATDGRAYFTPWLIERPPPSILLQDLLRIKEGENEYYPNFTELRRSLAAQGIDVTTCRTVGIYCQALYKAGVLPSSMTSTMDRTLYAKILETTFKGGLSADVALKLKDYLLPQQSQVEELVRGLQECTNDVIKTRNALSSADRELALLRSTYGLGKEALLTALGSIRYDKQHNEELIQLEHQKFENTRLELQGIVDGLPILEEQIEITERTKKTALHNIFAKLNLLNTQKRDLDSVKREAEKKLRDAKADQRRFNDGGKLWKRLAGQHERDDYEEVSAKLKIDINQAKQKIYETDSELKKLQEEDARISSDKSSITSEHLADLLGGQSLEEALGHVSEKESIALEMTLGGLTEGAVGVEIDALFKIKPSDDIPEMFWLGSQNPNARPVREIGNWYLTALADGYIVASKSRASVFGNEARKQRRFAIQKEIIKLSERRVIQSHDEERVQNAWEELLENKDTVAMYLANRGNSLGIDKAVVEATKALERSLSESESAAKELQKVENEAELVSEPIDVKLKEFRNEKEQKLARKPLLERDITESLASIQKSQLLLDIANSEFMESKRVLGVEFEKLWANALSYNHGETYNYSSQARRVVEVTQTIGEETKLKYDSLRDVDAMDRIKVVRMWPDIMTIVRDSISIDLADLDGANLMESMQSKRANLDKDLAIQENEVRINAKNIFIHINTSVRSQKQKIDKLSRLGQNLKFGNIEGIRIQLVPKPIMLNILENFASALSLFNKEKSVDQALREFFEHASTGNIKMEGKHLLDYRNYVDLVIEAKRTEGNWKTASGLSGGEAIGCGLAIALMLTRSIASRAEANGEGIRAEQISPLFAVDEANRLNESGQKILVEFAKRERFQLIFAAPKLTPEYDCTIYALNRTFNPIPRISIRALRYLNSTGKAIAG